MSLALSAEENEYIDLLGSLVRNNTIELGALLVLYGAFIVVFIGATHILVWRSTSSRMALALLVLSICLFISTTSRAVSLFTFVMTQMKGYWNISDKPLEDRRAWVRDRIYPLDRLQEFTRAFNVIFSDAIVVGRAWVLYRPNRIPQIVLSVMMVVNACALMTGPIMVSVSHNTVDFDLKKVYCASMFFSSGTNLTATCMIGLKAWAHRQGSQRVLDRSRPDVIGRIFLLLIESGVTFALFQIIDAILNTAISFDVPSAGTTTTYIFDEIVIVLAGIYPLLVLFAVRQSQSPTSASLIMPTFLRSSTAGGDSSTRREGGSMSMIRFSSPKDVQTRVNEEDQADLELGGMLGKRDPSESDWPVRAV